MTDLSRIDFWKALEFFTKGNPMDKEESARLDAILALERAHPEEYQELFRVELLKRGLELVKMQRTITKEVPELEALTLERNGWVRVS
jgi:hypothetical protein